MTHVRIEEHDMTTTTGGIVLGPGEGAAHWFLTNRITLKATAATTGGTLRC